VRAMNTYLDNLLSTQQAVDSVVWFDQTITLASSNNIHTTIPPEMSSEIIWELCEVGFRLELRHIDQCLAPHLWKGSDRNARDEALRRVFPLEADGSPSDYIPGVFPIADSGLASTEAGESVRATLAFRLVVSDWPDCPSTIKVATIQPDEPSVTSLLNSVMRFYCQTFFDCFGRPPVVPHRLPPSALARKAPRRVVDSV
ncbi:hypothetical protein BKA70DRAFT_1071146, partial [Coprinopsis sp. MPI-PUGE-AT-0042]